MSATSECKPSELRFELGDGAVGRHRRDVDEKDLVRKFRAHIDLVSLRRGPKADSGQGLRCGVRASTALHRLTTFEREAERSGVGSQLSEMHLGDLDTRVCGVEISRDCPRASTGGGFLAGLIDGGDGECSD